jgi:rhamnose utilization protein RhaD (predicted bifunctional aldolase and dehydrogenase)
MQSLWKDEEARQFQGDLGLRVYTSRLLGRDKSLVLHGGGNTSVKIKEKNLFGEDETILYVRAAAGTWRRSSRRGSRRCAFRTFFGSRSCRPSPTPRW